MQFLLSALISAVVSIGSLLGLHHVEQQQPLTHQMQQAIQQYVADSQANPQFGSTLPIAGSTYTLSGSGVSASAVSLTLSSFTVTQNGYKITDADMSDTFYLTLEPGNSSRQEIVSCTTVVQNANGSATLSGCTRGLSPISPYTASSSLKFAHSGGTQVIFSNPPQFYNQFAILANTNVFAGTNTFGGATTFTNSPTLTNACTGASANSAICDKAYIDGVAVAGASNANDTTKGIVETATAAEAGAGTTNGGTGARLALGANLATSTCQTTGFSVLVASSTTGKLNPSCFDQTYPYNFTATTTFATTTMASTTITNSLNISTSTIKFAGRTLNASSTFGGTGSDGALSISSGTTVIDVGTNSYVEKNYTSISITGTGALSFTSSATSSAGVQVVLRSQGDVTLTSNSATMINLKFLGGGANGQSGFGCGNCSDTGGGGGGGASGAMGSDGSTNDGNGGALIYFGGRGGPAQPALTPFVRRAYPGGDGASENGGVGGKGSGSLYLEVGGAYNCTTGTIDAAGRNGTSGTAGGGGGGGGSVLVLYNALTANSCTYTVTGGSGGSGGGTGGTGQHLEKQNTMHF